MTKNPLIPEIVWAHTQEEIVTQYTMCIACGPTEVPAKVFYISGTSYCATHAREVYAQWKQHSEHLPPTA